MPVSQRFNDSLADLMVKKQTVDSPKRGRPPDENAGTHIKQPLARPKKDPAHQAQMWLAVEAMESVKARREKIKAACNKLEKTSNERINSDDKEDKGATMVKPSEVDESTSCVTC